MSPQNESAQSNIWELVLGFANTAVIHALVKTGVIEELRQQSRTIDELSESCKLNSDILFRVLRFATAINIVKKDESGYALTETGTLLLKDIPGSVYTGIQLFGSEPWLRSWQDLVYSLTTGGIAFENAMGDPFFKFLEKYPEYGTPFHQWMTILTTTAARAITEVYDFTPYKNICDIGGGQGILLKTILEANPHLHGILYDQQSVVKDNILAGLEGRVEIQTGNFFERVPAAGILMMKNILHDWSDEKCGIILDNCRKSMMTDSRLLVIERIIEVPLDITGVFYDLHMHIISAGRERTATEFNQLLQKSGLKLNRVISTKSPMKIIEARTK